MNSKEVFMRPPVEEEKVELYEEFDYMRDEEAVFIISCYYEMHGFIPEC